MFKKLLVALVVAVSGLIVAQPTPVSAQAVPTYDYFCHRSNSATNPYQVKPFSETYSEIDGQGNNDHTQHTGPVVESVVEAQLLKDAKIDWGDIIPPVAGVLPNGYNWTDDGQDIWENACEFNVESPVAYCNVLQATALGGSEFQFDAEAVVANGPSIESYNYDFGDGQSTGEVTETTVSHTYADPGEYTATVVVTFSVWNDNESQETFTDECSTTVTIAEEDGEVLGEVTHGPQVTQTPVGAVNAGTGSTSKVAALVGLVSSAGVLALALRRKLTA